VLALGALIAPRAGLAWNPNAHTYAGSVARQDAIDDGHVTINGRSYPVRAEVVTALQDWPQFYNAGVVGPDGFPDITYGQVVIHPVHTGQWMRHIFNSGWAAQADASYTAQEKSQILAFTYGYLTHSAGDMWAHALVNDLSDPAHTIGVFPAISDALTDLNKAGIAIRHLILERYMADGTPGVDGNPERGPAPGGDVSDDSSPGIPFDSPHRFVYETLINPATLTPIPAVRGSYSDARGPILGFFLELRDDLQDFVDYDPDLLGDVINAYNDTIEDLIQLECACNFSASTPNGCDNACCFGFCPDACDIAHDTFACPAALLELGFDFVVDSFEAFLAVVVDITEEVALLVLDAYVGAWIDDINDGLQHWDELGLRFSRGFFDPQARRDLQNDECHLEGSEASLLRSNCEDGVGTLDVILHEVDPFINDHLLSMIGLPDFVGEVREILGDVADFVDDIISYIGLPFRPFEEALEELKEYIKDLIQDQIAESFGIDIEAMQEFIHSPNRFVCLDNTPFHLPFLGDVSLPLFPDGTVERLDGLMHLSGGHVQELGIPLSCGRFTDDATVDTDLFSPLRNTVTMGKLLLLDGAELNHVLSDELGRTISTYGPNDDIMFTALDGTDWLELIDGDHAWRQDGAPVFPARDPEITAGLGQFPIFESCVQRRAMRSLFVDWENGTDQFPDLGDLVSADPVNDPNAPTSTLARAGAFYDDGVHEFVAADNEFTHTAADGPAGKAFPDDALELQHRVYPALDPAPAFVTTGQGATFSISGADGIYTVDVRSGDACHTCAEGDGLTPEATKTHDFVLDATAPVATCGTPPFGLTFDTDDFSAVQFTLSDGPLGSGVASHSELLDGYLTATGTTPAPVGTVLDMYLLYPGTRTVTINAADNLGNTGDNFCTFEIHPTLESMLSNLNRALSEGAIKNDGIFRSFQAKLNASLAAMNRGQCGAAFNNLAALTNELQAQRGKGIDAVVADRFIAFAQDLIDTGAPGCPAHSAVGVGE